MSFQSAQWLRLQTYPAACQCLCCLNCCLKKKREKKGHESGGGDVSIFGGVGGCSLFEEDGSVPTPFS